MFNAAVFKLIVPSEDVEEFFDWKECVAFRFVDMGDGTVRLQFADDLELLTRPEGAGRVVA